MAKERRRPGNPKIRTQASMAPPRAMDQTRIPEAEAVVPAGVLATVSVAWAASVLVIVTVAGLKLQVGMF